MNCSGQAGRAGTNYRHRNAVVRQAAYLHIIQASVGYVMLNGADLHGVAFASQNAVALALLLVVADNRADQGEGIVVEQQLAGLNQAVLF